VSEGEEKKLVEDAKGHPKGKTRVGPAGKSVRSVEVDVARPRGIWILTWIWIWIWI
jgi:hypothetical protein